jgi:hypothetical protein
MTMILKDSNVLSSQNAHIVTNNVIARQLNFNIHQSIGVKSMAQI